MSQQLAVDIGGTFVDAIAFDEASGEMRLEKASTTEENPAQGVLAAIEKLDTLFGRGLLVSSQQ
jgi:N-methylhydantoinase A